MAKLVKHYVILDKVKVRKSDSENVDFRKQTEMVNLKQLMLMLDKNLLDLNKEKLKEIGVFVNILKDDMEDKPTRKLIQEIQGYLET